MDRYKYLPTIICHLLLLLFVSCKSSYMVEGEYDLVIATVDDSLRVNGVAILPLTQLRTGSHSDLLNNSGSPVLASLRKWESIVELDSNSAVAVAVKTTTDYNILYKIWELLRLRQVSGADLFVDGEKVQHISFREDEDLTVDQLYAHFGISINGYRIVVSRNASGVVAAQFLPYYLFDNGEGSRDLVYRDNYGYDSINGIRIDLPQTREGNSYEEKDLNDIILKTNTARRESDFMEKCWCNKETGGYLINPRGWIEVDSINPDSSYKLVHVDSAGVFIDTLESVVPSEYERCDVSVSDLVRKSILQVRENARKYYPSVVDTNCLTLFLSEEVPAGVIKKTIENAGMHGFDRFYFEPFQHRRKYKQRPHRSTFVTSGHFFGDYYLHYRRREDIRRDLGIDYRQRKNRVVDSCSARYREITGNDSVPAGYLVVNWNVRKDGTVLGVENCCSTSIDPVLDSLVYDYIAHYKFSEHDSVRSGTTAKNTFKFGDPKGYDRWGGGTRPFVEGRFSQRGDISFPPGCSADNLEIKSGIYEGEIFDDGSYEIDQAPEVVQAVKITRYYQLLYLAVSVGDSTKPLIFDEKTTAQALVFFHHGIYTADCDSAKVLLERITRCQTFPTLVGKLEEYRHRQIFEVGKSPFVKELIDKVVAELPKQH